jgi:hypothetical protein
VEPDGHGWAGIAANKSRSFDIYFQDLREFRRKSGSMGAAAMRSRSKTALPCGRILFRLAGLLILWAGTACRGAEPARPPVYTELKFSGPLPALVAIAEQENVHGGTFDPPVERDDLIPGDYITALVTLIKGDDVSQWLVRMTCVELNDAEKKRPLAKPQRLYTSLGTEVVFQEQRAAMSIRVLGPYHKVNDFKDPAQRKAALKDGKDVSARLTVNADFLRLGFDRACESVLFARQTLKGQPALNWNIAAKPFPTEIVAKDRDRAESVGLTRERQRAFAGTIPALHEFWRLASRTPGLQDIVKDVADLPWWAIIRKGGEVKTKLKPKFAAVDTLKLVGLPNYTVGYTFPFEVEVNGEVALSCSVLAVSPRPPMLAAAGILAIAAQAPGGKGPHLMVQICATHLAPRPQSPVVSGL